MSKVSAGLDLQITKITSFVLVSENSWKAYFWLPEKRLPRFNLFLRKKYLDWVSDGYIRLTPGNMADYEIIFKDICEINSKTPFAEIAFDRFGSSVFATILSNVGARVIGVSQGFLTFSPVSQEYIHSKPFFENPVLKWMDSNLSFLSDPAGNQKPNKRKGEIGGVVAGLMAMSLACAPTPFAPDKSGAGSAAPAFVCTVSIPAQNGESIPPAFVR